ncbi:ribosomal protein [Lithospermum erythrorhizon]|uniref:Ribosomal protein n=1 Tax=Lithospermum erythrorhizon TaxID=34254 RepID=A0AAV3PR75_LITER
MDSDASAVAALLKWKSLQTPKDNLNNPSDQNNLDFIYLVLTLKNVPPKPLQNTPHKIPLPHTLHPFPNICLILADGPKKSTHKLTVDHVQKLIKSQNISVSKVVKLSKLRSLCNSLDTRRVFLDSYDVFLADERIINLLPSVLGKLFYKKKVPIPVTLKRGENGGLSLKEEVEKACCSEMLSFGSGTCHSVRVGRRGVMGVDEIVENVREAIDGVVEFVPKKWKGVGALHLKFSDSLAMPIFGVSGLRDDEGVMKRGEVEVGGDGGGRKLARMSR